ncbi:hypothetical protein NLI96_g12079 [Meripilus lineatus]|uniref:Uncharacterized protein n=1 Tax=Meripilus lineatus TaxID=2056292 RepID=A0AAD5YCT0_9APHY|nr:hypothetical protein NLI96_g12079 [Physisporinus lineatus]
MVELDERQRPRIIHTDDGRKPSGATSRRGLAPVTIEDVEDESESKRYPRLTNENYVLEKIEDQQEPQGEHPIDAPNTETECTNEGIRVDQIPKRSSPVKTVRPRRQVPVRRGNSERDRARVPNIAEKFVPTRHSSLEVPRDKFGEEDKLGMNDLIWEEVKSELEELKNLEKFKPRKTDQLREQWFIKCQDIMNGAPPRLPPMREINHHIPLIDQNKRYMYHLPHCPDAMKVDLMTKIDKYLKAEWWQRATVSQAAPLLCIPKKSGQLRTVVDCRKRNENTVRDVTPFPDQDQIRMDVARARVRSKIDLSDAYEQIRIIPDDVLKTAFATVFGTFTSQVMQQGDWKFVHVYLDDIFVFSDSIEEHEEHLKLVFSILWRAELYLKKEKCDLYSDRMDCLGHIIDDQGLHADGDKMHHIREWRVPRNTKDVQRFLGLVQYIAHFMPDVSAFTGPLHNIEQNGHLFEWRPIHQKCFDSIKALACKTPILRPIDPKIDETIWVICDASNSGVGAVYGQGPDWQTCRPAGFMSKKLTNAQHSYRVFEFELIAIIEALLKWEDKLLGQKFTVVTDHKALTFMKEIPRLNSRQTRWMEFLQRFSYNIKYVEGHLNKVADSLSRYFASDDWNEIHPIQDYVNADQRLDPTGADLPLDRNNELRAMRTQKELRVIRLREEVEPRTLEAAELSRDSTMSNQHGGQDEEMSLRDTQTNGPPLPPRVEEAIPLRTEARKKMAEFCDFRAQ